MDSQSQSQSESNSQSQSESHSTSLDNSKKEMSYFQRFMSWFIVDVNSNVMGCKSDTKRRPRSVTYFHDPREEYDDYGNYNDDYSGVTITINRSNRANHENGGNLWLKQRSHSKESSEYHVPTYSNSSSQSSFYDDENNESDNESDSEDTSNLSCFSWRKGGRKGGSKGRRKGRSKGGRRENGKENGRRKDEDIEMVDFDRKSFSITGISVDVNSGYSLSTRKLDGDPKYKRDRELEGDEDMLNDVQTASNNVSNTKYGTISSHYTHGGGKFYDIKI